MQNSLIEKIKNAGIIGAGGAGFPTHVKCSASAEYVIVNGAECEPLIKVDQQLLEYEAEKIIESLGKVIEITGAQKGIIALKGKYKKAIKSLEQKISHKNIEIYLLDDFYPAGDEQVLVYEVLNRIVPEGGIPLKVGCIVINVETLLNIYNALQDKPVTDTYITVNGDVPNPITLKVPIGTSISEVIALAGRKDLNAMVVLEGGPMMGKIIEDFQKPVIKTTKALLVLPKNHSLIIKKTMPMKYIIRQAKSACIQCQRCTEICPRNLLGHNIEPHKIMRGLNYSSSSQIDSFKMAFLCSECGACEQYACPMMLSPRKINSEIKSELTKKGIKPLDLQQTPQRKFVREYRKIPVYRLKQQLGLSDFDHDAPLLDLQYEPSSVRIPLKQHIGKPSIPIVKVGDVVQKGKLIAEIPEDSLGVNIHASINGTVAEVNSNYIAIESVKKEVGK